ncbi:MAG: isoprenylcysteine carboxylmethyltransferase family protein [Lysobacterales bacterium]
MTALELRIPPLLLLLLCAGCMWLIAGCPVWPAPPPMHALAALLLWLAGLGVALSGVLAFRRAQTTVDPTRPERAGRIVSSGIYRWTRNPMYLGMTLVLLAWALWLGAPAAAGLLPVFVLWISRWQIVPEERALAARFGSEYRAYCARVRRWI